MKVYVKMNITALDNTGYPYSHPTEEKLKTAMFSSCSMAEITNMGYGELDGKKLFLKFLKDCSMIYPIKDLKTMVTTYHISGGYPMFTFDGVVKGYRNAGGTSSPKNPFNGVTFAAFILENNLGDVATVPPRPNKFHGNDRLTQAWVWGPDYEAITKWCEKEGVTT